MTITYKINNVAKDLNIPVKQVIEIVAQMGGEPKKTGGSLNEAEMNYLMEAYTQQNAESDLSAFWASQEPEKPAAEQKQPAPKAEAPKAKAKEEPKRQAAQKRSDKTVTLADLAKDSGAKAAAQVETVEVKRETRTVDTRTVDVNVDRFNAKYDDLASTKNTDNRRKASAGGNKQKFTQRGQKQRQQFQKGKRETEFERLQRIQLEKARNAQLKISIPDEITVGELATRLKQNVAKVVAKFMQMGEMHAASDVIDFDSAALIAEEFHAKVEHEVHVSIEERLFTQEEDSADQLVERPPVVVVMGHVDHGKTSILDRIRSTNVTAGEAGGITQAIGAYQVNVNGSPVTFLDTPGHEAFTAMRARGADMTDIAVLVVAADDGIMPQTIESINHAKAAEIPIIVAINKMDKPEANPERIKQQLTEYGLVCEEWGGDTIVCPISAKTGMGVDNLLEMLTLTAEVGELKANPNRAAQGTVIEARLDKGRGPVATLLVQNGTLHQGDIIIAGTSVGRVRAMVSDKGQRITEAGPSVPVEITGLSEAPSAGATFNAVADEKLARELVEQRKAEEKAKANAPVTKVSLEDLFSQIQAGEMKNLNLIVKADVQGSVEAVKASLEKLSNEEVRVRVIHGGVGAINESDVMLASTSQAIIVGFNVRPDAAARESAARANVDMRMYRVIYDAINEIEAAMKGMLAPKFREVLLGHAEVRQTYKVSGVGTVAGCYVQDGKLQRKDCQVRLVRDGIVIHEGVLASLQRFKDSVKEVQAGYECGLSIEKFNDIKEGDIVEAFTMEQIEV